MAGILRIGRAGSNTAADHIAVLDQGLGQLPEAARAGRILVRTDGAGFSHEFLDHLVKQQLEYSTGYAVTEDVRDAITLLPEWAWTPAVDADGGLRDGAEVAELTDVLREARRLAAARRRRDRAKKAQANGQNGQKVRSERDKPPQWPDGMRVLVRRERPHLGAQLDAFEERDGWRYQAIATNTRCRAAGVPRSSPPRARPGRGPHPASQGRRPGPVAVQAVRDQRSLARARPDRR